MTLDGKLKMFRDFNDKTQRQNLSLSDQIDINHTLILTKISSHFTAFISF